MKKIYQVKGRRKKARKGKELGKRGRGMRSIYTKIKEIFLPVWKKSIGKYWIQYFLSSKYWIPFGSTSLLLLVKHVRAFWYRKNCPTYSQFLTFFLWKIRTWTWNLHKFINIQYFLNLIRISLDSLFKNKNFFLHTTRITAVVLSAAGHLKFRGSSAKIVYRSDLKKNYKMFFYTL